MNTYNLESISNFNYLSHGIFIADVQCRHGRNALVPMNNVLCYRYGFVESVEHLGNICRAFFDWYNKQFYDANYREETKNSTFALMNQNLKENTIPYYVDSLDFIDACIEFFYPDLCTESPGMFHSSLNRPTKNRRHGVKIRNASID